MTHAVGWRAGDDAYLAFGTDPQSLPVYEVVGAVASPEALIATRLRFPGCLRFMPEADPVLDLAEIDDDRAERYRSLVTTTASRLGL